MSRFWAEFRETEGNPEGEHSLTFRDLNPPDCLEIVRSEPSPSSSLYN